MKKWLIPFSVVPFLVMGCDTEMKQGFSEQKLQQSWVLTKVDGKAITITEPRTVPGMSIDANLKVSGFSGCNRFFGQAEVKEGNKFRLTGMGSTKMACIQEDQAKVESVMTKSLQSWNNAALENNILTLTSEQHILTFMPENVVEEKATQ
ncbi:MULTISPECIES: META domain-containing protein [Photobacterium]|uniref:Heat-shock protein HslJ n=1 Tax=Photobacterium ganghwense TaxID=320778 RepID=A0A0J1GYK4_9GAMM|nr:MULTISPECIES: META domain-containing protein [Photobacterium]KLV04574.1 heat-shock protein HslJ [Photobacterium ganghwense]MBV1841882.1 META domain-containing protein [Photobacterium ganghwense]PSU09458.1 META domain-containing protein [Photobacterium ganghwense]QSV16700.1 META domain-containing protein [Photobacterium ganghwense]